MNAIIEPPRAGSRSIEQEMETSRRARPTPDSLAGILAAEKAISKMDASDYGELLKRRMTCPEDGFLWLWSGLYLDAEGHADAACEEFLAAGKLGCTHWRVGWYLAQAARQAGRLELMHNACAAVLSANPDFEPARTLSKQARQLPKPMPELAKEALAKPAVADSSSPSKPLARLLAFYLPQFHPIEENDRWWGKGFTEWTNVAQATPRFSGHLQPQIPGELGFYDLRLAESRIAQADLARAHGIEAFCYWHYWFNGRRILQRPFEEVLASGRPDFGFCLAWANENWTRRWDGQESEILLAQTYGGDEDDRAHFHSLLPAFRDPRAFRIDGKPVFLIYRPAHLPDAPHTIELWRQLAREAGLSGLYFIAISTCFDESDVDWTQKGFDAKLYFQPDFSEKMRNSATVLEGTGDRVVQYADVWPQMSRGAEVGSGSETFGCVVPSWDNCARRKREAFIIHNSTPAEYGLWLRQEIARVQGRAEQHRVVFINAWNEWAEGNHLEPDLKWGRAYLEETLRAKEGLLSAEPVPANHSMPPPVEACPARESEAPSISGAPAVSIIIPVLNKIDLTKKCLAALEKHTPPELCEVIVWDNGSTDSTRAFFQQPAASQQAMRYFRSEENLGFVGGNNAAAQHARGRHIVFLNNDTEPKAGWLEALLQTIEADPRIGAVGAKLIYPSGQLQEAGGIIFRDASGWNYGRTGDPCDPRFNFVREVDYCSAACLLVRTDLFRQLGGFDSRYAPAYYEDTDLCFGLRQAGYKVVYQPRCEIIHHEGATSGQDLTNGFKQHQVTNRKKFLEKWEKVLAHQAAPDASQVRRASHRARGRRILIIDPVMPMYDRASGSKRLFEMLKLLAAAGHAVTFIARNGHHGERYAAELSQLGIEVYAGDAERMKELGFTTNCRPFDLKKLLQDSQYDAIILSFWYIAEQYLARIRSWSPASQLLIDTVDVHFLRERRQAELYQDQKLLQQAANTYRRELGAYRLADGLITVTEDDRQTLLREMPEARISVVPNIHELATDVPPIDHRDGLLFIGGFSHTPNEDAVLYFHREIWPRILQRVPTARWSIVGNNPPPAVQALAGPAIQVTGYVPDIEPRLRSHLISVAPLRYGAGMKGKIGEALAHGLPVVTTSIGAEGMSFKNGESGVLVGDDPETFAAQVAKLYADRDLWNQLSAQGRRHIESHFTPQCVGRRLEMVLDGNVSLISIIVLAHNQREQTEKCLQSIARHTPAPRHEVIVVDNGSTDSTVDFLRAEEAAGRLRAILNADNAGSAKACNQGARAARGKYLVFLHSDTEVQSNWLGSLFSLAEADPTVAVVGSKLLFPDGTIQHAGIALADCWDHDPLLAFHLFAHEKADFPLVNQRRVYQAVSAACMLVRKAHFDQVSGFDEHYWNGCDDVDLCLRFQQMGWLTVYEPASVVIHHESPSGPEPSARARENLERFHRQWLENASPDVTIDQEGKNRMAATSVMRLYSPPPGKLVSIVILAHNQLHDTKHCLASIEKHTPMAHELILVDNGSTDGTGQFFRNYAAKHNHVRLILNRANLGFSAGNNQGLACASGEAILLLNNDTVVTPGWLARMLANLDLYPDCGLIGPVSNRVSGPQLVSTANYSSLDQLPKFATQWCATHAGQSTEAVRLVGFCLLLRRAVLKKIGGLDPQFGSGNFEDDDFCLRAGLAGFKLRIALDSFVHHTGGQTFKGAKIDYRASMERNWSLFKTKWALPQDVPLEKGYRLPAAPPQGLALRLPLPGLKDSHTSSLEGRCWTDKTLPGAAPKKSARKPTVVALPPCAVIGHLGEARELARKKQCPAAWKATLSAMDARPYHPEACLLLAEIAQAAGDAESARRCAHAARDMAPGWAPPKQFLKGHLRGNSKPEWLKLPPALSHPPGASAPRVSVCLIARNEEQFLAQCLRSVRPLASQIIVVDTGSTDRTIEIAREFGAEVHTFAWCDDFSAARNAALEHATGDWVLVIDADEELNPQQIKTAQREIQAGTVMGYRLPIIDQGREDGGCSYVPRLFRNAPGLFFVGRIHEQAFSSIHVRCQQWGLKHQLGETTLLHHGYTEEIVASRHKVERNLRLLERAVEELPEEPNLVMSLGLELVRSGKLEAGLDRYWEAFRLLSALPASEVTPELQETLLTQLAAHLMTAKRFAEIVQLWEIPFAKNGGMTASQHFGLGVALMELKQPAEAAEQMRQCLAKRDRPALSPINPDIRRAGPHHCLAMCLTVLSAAEGAQRAFEDALTADPSSRPIRFDLARFHASQGRTSEALKGLRQLAAEKPVEARVWELGGQIALSQPEHLAFARDWTAEAVKDFPENESLLSQRAEALLLNQDIAQALPLWRRGQAAASMRQRAAIMICELLAGDRQHHFTAAEEPAMSREVVQWYRQCIRMGAHALIHQLHERMETIRLTLPAFVRVLEAAHRQARQAAA